MKKTILDYVEEELQLIILSLTQNKGKYVDYNRNQLFELHNYLIKVCYYLFHVWDKVSSKKLNRELLQLKNELVEIVLFDNLHQNIKAILV